ncbi:MAG: acyl-CoA/acyl-ACP dehydrogenase [Actinobacteria bacterium]|nr:acyl-CoA/acyl-ACP dehydrogenase [Actinomycetota bacterium]
MGEHDIFPCLREWMSEMDISLAENLRRWAENEVMAKRLELKEDYQALLEPAMHKLFLEIGLQRLLWPEEHGGDGHNAPAAALTVTAALEQVARGDVGIALFLSSLFALQSAVAMEGAVNGEACAALEEKIAGKETPALVSLVLPLYRGEPQAKAKGGKGGWTVEAAHARPVAGGGNGNLFGVLCRLEGSDDGVALLVVPGESKGVQRGEVLKRTGLAADRSAAVGFAKVKVPEGMCVARGEEACRGVLSWLYLGISASNVGALFASYEILREWGDNRVIKGRGNIFKENPLTASVMAEVAKETSLCRLLTWNLARVLSHPDLYGPPGAEANYVTALMVAHQVSQSAEKAINNAMEMMASAGYAKEWNLERYWRDVKTMQSCLGPYELAKMDVSRYFYRASGL